MINIDDFVKRLEKILDYYSLSASAFADALGIQRSGISHLMSGRNKPSLDLVMKIIEKYPEVDLYWLLNGTGNFPKHDERNAIAYPPAPTPEKDQKASVNNNRQQAPDLFSVNEKQEFSQPAKAVDADMKYKINTGNVDRIVVFYNNGTFKSYSSEK